MDYQRMRDLLELSERYDQEGHKGTTADFLAWANKQPSKYDSLMGAPEEGLHNIDSLLGMLVTFIYRYAKGYLKKGLAHVDLSGEEFGYLAGMQYCPAGMSKMDLIAENVHEKTTGMEIIGRLLKKGLLKQANNPADGRSKLLFITDKGRQVLGSSYQPLYEAAKIIGGNLSPAEKLQLRAILEKLHHFHKPIYLNEKDSSLREISGKYGIDAV